MARTDYGAILSTVIKDTSDAIREVNGTSALIAPNAWGVNIRTMKSADDYENVLDQLVQEEVASAPVASFSDGANDIPLKELSLSINPTQSGSGDPYPAGGSAQKWDEVWESGSINTSGVNVPDSTRIRSVNYCDCLPSTTYYAVIPSGKTVAFRFYDSSKNHVENKTLTTSGTFTTNASTAYFRLLVVDTTTYGNNISINYPSTDTSYHSYSNIRPITGVSSVNVTRTGASLVEVSDKAGSINNGYFYSFTTGYTLQADVTYTLTMVVNTTVEPFAISVGVGDGSSYRADIAYTEIVNRNGVVSITFTPTSANLQNWNVLWFRAPRYSTPQELHPTTCTFTITNISLVTSVDTYTIALGDTYYGATLDVVRGKLRVTNAYKYLDGSEDESWNLVTSVTYPYLSHGTLDCKELTSLGVPFTCNMFPHVSITNTNNLIGADIVWRSFRIRMATMPVDVTAWRTWLSNNPIQLVYELATPIEIDLTPTQINALLGSNNIWHDGNGNTSCTYYANGQLYVEQHST